MIGTEVIVVICIIADGDILLVVEFMSDEVAVINIVVVIGCS